MRSSSCGASCCMCCRAASSRSVITASSLIAIARPSCTADSPSSPRPIRSIPHDTRARLPRIEDDSRVRRAVPHRAASPVPFSTSSSQTEDISDGPAPPKFPPSLPHPRRGHAPHALFRRYLSLLYNPHSKFRGRLSCNNPYQQCGGAELFWALSMFFCRRTADTVLMCYRQLFLGDRLPTGPFRAGWSHL